MSPTLLRRGWRTSLSVLSTVIVASSVLMAVSDARVEASGGGAPVTGPLSGPDAAPGPLVVSPTNPRYFTVGSGSAAGEKAVYLTGSHVWNNFHDGLGPDTSICASEENDYAAYLDFLKDHGHNFVRLWRWEQVSSSVPAGFHLCMTPQPWQRTGPGMAVDGQPAFDLTTFDQSYFDRLRERVIAAGNEGIYVSVMFFDGFCFLECERPNNVAGHPFHAGNNVNGIGITSITDYQVLPVDPRVLDLQKAYLRKVVDTVHDLPNVLYEVANESSGATAHEGDSTEWQYWVIDYVKQYETEKGYQKHPVGMTFQVGEYGQDENGLPVQGPDARPNAPLFEGPADWISPGFEEVYFLDPWFTDPPASDGTKVVISDTDHYASGLGTSLWAWKTFLRGHNPILMDFGIINVADPLPGDPSAGLPEYSYYEPARYAMGDTLRYAS